MNVGKRFRLKNGTSLYVTVEEWALDTMIIEKIYNACIATSHVPIQKKKPPQEKIEVNRVAESLKSV